MNKVNKASKANKAMRWKSMIGKMCTALMTAQLLLPALLTGGGSAYADPPELPATVYESFEDSPLGSAPVGWTLPAASVGTAAVVDKIGFTGEKALKLTKNAASSDFAEFVKTFDRREQPFTMEYDFLMGADSKKSFWVDIDNTQPFPYATAYSTYLTSPYMRAFNQGANTALSLAASS